MNTKHTLTAIITSALLALASSSWAETDRGDRIDNRLDQKGDHINLKKSFQPRKHTEDTETQYLRGAAIHHLAGVGGVGVKLMILSGFFRVIPWQMRFIGLIRWFLNQDNKQALVWITKAAEDGNHLAVKTLAGIYLYGDLGLSAAPVAAAEWERKAQTYR